MPQTNLSRGPILKKMKSTFLRLTACTVLFTLFAITLISCANPALEHLKRGDAYFQAGNYDDAISEYGKAGELDPALDVKSKINEANEKKIDVLLQAGDYDKPIEETKKALAIAPSDNLSKKLADLYIGRAWFYKEKRLNPYALKDLLSAIETAPDYFKAHYELGRFYNDQWQYNLGIYELNKALGLAPDFAPAYSERAFGYYKNQKWDAALADADKSIELGPGDAQFYYIRSLIYRSIGKNDLATSDLQTTLSLSKDENLTDKANADLQAIKSQ